MMGFGFGAGYGGFAADSESLYANGGDGMQGLGDLGAIPAPLVYVPNMMAVGSEAAGTYYPGDVADDAKALAFLGFLPESALAVIGTTRGSRAADQPFAIAGFNPQFKAGVGAFQASPLGQQFGAGTADTRVGPNTRQALAKAVLQENARRAAGALPAPPQPAPPIAPPAVPALPAPVPPFKPGVLPEPVSPASSTTGGGMSTGTKVALGVGGVALLGLAAWAMMD